MIFMSVYGILKTLQINDTSSSVGGFLKKPSRDFYTISLLLVTCQGEKESPVLPRVLCEIHNSLDVQLPRFIVYSIFPYSAFLMEPLM